MVEVLEADPLTEAPIDTVMDSATVDEGLAVLDACIDGDDSVETEACNDSLNTDVAVASNVAEVEYETIGDILGALESEATAEDVWLTEPEADKLVVSVPVFEFVKDWLGLDECVGVLECVEEALIEEDKVGVLEFVEEALIEEDKVGVLEFVEEALIECENLLVFVP